MNISPSMSSLFGGIYAGKRVLVTGHTGFKGSWLALWLHELGAEVAGFALPPCTDPSHFDLIGLDKLIHHTEGDIRNVEEVNRVFEIAKPEIVFHLAAQALVRDSYNDPKTTLDTNIGGTVNVLEAIRHSPTVKAAVIVTSDKCYENKEWVWGYRENDPMGGHDLYSASKGATEIICASYRRSFFSKQSDRGLPIGFATARSGNVIGGGDWSKDRIIPDCVRALSNNKPVIVRNPQAIRPWQQVLEPLSGYLLLGQRLLESPNKYSGSWNFGPVDIEYLTVKELTERFVEAWGKGAIEIMNPDQASPHEAYLLRLIIDKAIFNLRWSPLLNNSVALDWTVEWYKAWHTNNQELRQLSLKHIRNYVDIALEKKAQWAK